ncbi:MAG: S1/P1 nuclease [Bacteriovorax sp.]|nr:S1/P1 nuclease [Rhizobacter sp.]
MLQILRALALFAGLQHAAAAMAFGASGHAFSGALADRLLNPHAARQVQLVLGMKLAVAATWADCAKDVAPGPAGFHYVPDPRFRPACEHFETPPGRARMADYVRRNWNVCSPASEVVACHKAYHFSDVAVQHERYDRRFIGTSDHDVVSALNATIAVLRDWPAPPPFSIRDRKEALLLLAHLVGDVHQPLHVGAVYLDARGAPVDPDAGAAASSLNTTRGGNSIADGATNLHALWDAIPPHLQPSRIDKATLAAARRIAANPLDPSAWPAAWATETLLASREAFDGLAFQPDAAKPGRWTVEYADRAAYMERKQAIQAQQLLRAGARLAQLLNALWP